MKLEEIENIDKLIRKQIDCSLNMSMTPELNLLCNIENLTGQLILLLKYPEEIKARNLKLDKLCGINDEKKM